MKTSQQTRCRVRILVGRGLSAQFSTFLCQQRRNCWRCLRGLTVPLVNPSVPGDGCDACQEGACQHRRLRNGGRHALHGGSAICSKRSGPNTNSDGAAAVGRDDAIATTGLIERPRPAGTDAVGRTCSC